MTTGETPAAAPGREDIDSLRGLRGRTGRRGAEGGESIEQERGGIRRCGPAEVSFTVPLGFKQSK